jgi:hypothetical protein
MGIPDRIFITQLNTTTRSISLYNPSTHLIRALVKHILTLLLVCGCMRLSSQQKQVWLGGLQATHNAEKVLRIYFDKKGDLYPDLGNPIPYNDFFDPTGTRDFYDEHNGNGNLESYYCHFPDRLKELAQLYHVPEEKECSSTFMKIQEKINANYGYRLNYLLNQSKTLIVLIHGFNDPNPTGDFQQLRSIIKKTCPTIEAVYLEVYWDGLTANQGSPQYAGIWARAQYNSGNVAIGLRMLLSQIRVNTHIRIITHSLGASVATGALFNTNSKWNHKEYEDFSKKTPVTNHNDIRLGMIAPAIPGATTFMDFNQRGKLEMDSNTNHINKIIIGYNRNDYAVTKRTWGRDHSGIFGSTSLGCDCGDEFNSSRTELIKCTHSAYYVDHLFFRHDFTQISKWALEEHNLYYYLINPTINGFIKLVLD